MRDAMAEAKKDPKWNKYARRARRKIKLQVLLYKIKKFFK